MIYYLKTDTEAEMWAALEAAGLAHEVDSAEGMVWTTKPPTIALDMIGTIHKGTGQWADGEDGIRYEITEALPGFHANLKAPEGITGLPTIPAPSSPARKWFGD